APAVQVTLADAEGVAQVLAGEIPRRPPEHPTAGRMPAPGRDPAVRWLEPVAPDDPLRMTEPAQGMVAATGAEATGASALALGHDRDEPLRLLRLSRLLAS